VSDIIQILPDSIANQIAAGEVIQRPASAVKELLENAVDSGATIVNLSVKDAGKTLIKIIDNGCGMSETDLRMSFERHATSKIRKIEDLFEIRTMGFRGEALASIASIAQVETKTKRVEDELGTLLSIDGSEVMSQEPCNVSDGTSIAIKNLFYNVPARRNFLKSNASEMKHIIEEFNRIALANPEITFMLNHNESEVYHLKKSSLRQRIVDLFGKKNFNERLVPLEEDTDIVKLTGFIGKPEFAKKTRGEQYFFVNKRFIKSPYLNHAVLSAFEELLPRDHFPLYVLFLDIDPKHIDINVHPTKTEIKFSDEKTIYAMIRSCVKHSLGKYNLTPSLDFEQERSYQELLSQKTNQSDIKSPAVNFNPDYNPFKTGKSKGKDNWQELYNIPDPPSHKESSAPQIDLSFKNLSSQQIESDNIESKKLVDDVDGLETYQLHKKYILCHIKSGLMIIDQHAAHERVLYERFLNYLKNNSGASQQALFPQTIELNADDHLLLKEALSEVKALGFDLEDFGKNTFIINGMPPELNDGNAIEIIEGLIEQYKQNLSILKLDKQECIARATAQNAAIKHGKDLSQEEMDTLIHDLFACQQPNIAPGGSSTVIKLTLDELMHKFENKIQH